MNSEGKKPFKRDHALNNATCGQFGEKSLPNPEEYSKMQKH